MSVDRRQFMNRAALGTFWFQVAGASQLLTPRAARAADAAFQVLTPAEVATLEAIGETLLPGALEAGIAPFVDQQLAAKPADSLLMLRYLDVPPPYVSFYRPVLGAIDAAAHAAHQRAFADLTTDAANTMVAQMVRENPPGWQGPPAPFAYFVLRSDAVDVVYGTMDGFQKLGIPYMPHIVPTTKW